MIEKLVKLCEENGFPLEQVLRDYEFEARKLAKREISKGNFEYTKPKQKYHFLDQSHHDALDIVERYYQVLGYKQKI